MKSLLSIILLLTFSFLSPQYINTDQFPPEIKWRVIDTSGFRIVFPEEISDEGQRVANILEHIYPKISANPLKGRNKITVFLNNSGVISNGYIQLAPRKGEFFSTPPQSGFTGNTEWYSLLSLHEGKHIDQFEQLNRGFTKTAGKIFGELGRAIFSGLSVPEWYWEGDSVFTETFYSSGGRGRLPSFGMGTKTILLSGKKYSYTKSYLNSYKDYVPNVYKLGYFMTTYLKNNYKGKTTEEILNNSSKYSFYPLIFSLSIKKEIGISLKELYKKVMNDLLIKWKEQDSKLNLSEFKKINLADKRGWTLYTSPKVLSNGKVIAQKYGLSVPLSLVEISSDGSERKIVNLKTVDHIMNTISVSKNIIAWNEPVKDIRWGKRSYSDIMIYKINQKTKKRLTKKKRYFSPAISPDGNIICCVKFSRLRESSIVLLNSSTGDVIKTFTSPDNSFLQTPSWSQNGKKIVLIRQSNGKKSITILDPDSGKFNDITKLDYESPSNPSFLLNYVIYSSPYSGINNIFLIDPDTGERFKMTTSRFGAFFPSSSDNGEKIIYCDYNYDGMDVVEIPFDLSKLTPINKVKIDRIEYFKYGTEKKTPYDLTEPKIIPSKIYTTKKYKRISDQINFHSMMIYPSLPEPTIEIYSNNKLNTTAITGGAGFNTNEKTGKLYLNATYSGFFPILKGGISTTERNSGYPYYLNWDETSMNFSIIIPLDLSRGAFTRKLSFESKISLTNISGSNEYEGYKIKEGNRNSITYNFSYSGIKQTAIRDVAPLSGTFVFSSYSHTPWKTFYRGERFFTLFGIYLRGLFNHNSIKLLFSYENQNPVNYLFSSLTPFSRGYNYEFFRKLTFASLDYAFPIAYPDISIDQILYLKRLKGTFFLDFGQGFNKDKIKNFNSVGFELKGDINLFSIPVNLEAGVRISYRLSDGSFSFEPLILGIGF